MLKVIFFKESFFTRLMWLTVGILAPVLVVVSALTVLAGQTIPKGTQIAFMADWSGTWDIHLLDLDRRLTRRLTYNDLDNRYPSWSPDGSQIIYHGGDFYTYTNYDLYIMDADGSNVRLLPISAQYQLSHEAMGMWSPDGKWITYHSNQSGEWDIYLTDANGENERRVIMNIGDSARLRWSPDGSQVAFTMGPSEYELQIYVMDSEAFLNPRPAWELDFARQLTTIDDGGSNFTHSWSPDGSQIIFTSDREGNTEIYVMNADGTNQRNLSNMPFANDSYPTWLDDGRIVFASTRNGLGYDLYIMNADGSNVRRLTHRGDIQISSFWNNAPRLTYGNAQAPVVRP